jgi:hypothetical protein
MSIRNITSVMSITGIIGFINRDRIFKKYKFDDNPDHHKIFEKYPNKFGIGINWIRLSNDPNLSPIFIDKYKDDVDWFHILMTCTYDRGLTNHEYEWWINKYKKKFDWNYVSYDKLSYQFVIDHCRFINLK